MISPVTAVVGALAATGYVATTTLQIRHFRQNLVVDKKLLMAIALPTLALHGLTNLWLISTPEGLVLDLFTSASVVTWIMVSFVLGASFRLPVQNLVMLIGPLATLSICAALAWDSSYTPMTTIAQSLAWHILLSIIAYSILFMAACQSVLLAILEDRLRSRQTYTLIRLLPPLQSMEKLLFNLLWAGVIALTCAILSGFVFLDDLFGQRVVHHTVLAIASWIVYVTLLAGHHVLGWRGTTAVRWTLIAFTLLVLGYFGSKFVIEILLGD